MPQVLIVDDDVSFRETTTQMLQLDGYRVTAADSVRGALSVLGFTKPDALLVDWKLPDGTALEVLHWMALRKSRIPSALITGFWTDPDYQLAQTAVRGFGVEVVIQRGLDFLEPGEIVHRLLDPLATLHAGVLRGDTAARERVAGALMRRTASRLQSRFPMVSPDLVSAATLDAIMSYVDFPSHFKPSRAVSVASFVFMLARRRLWNDVRAERRRRQREKEYAFLRHVMVASESFDGSPGQLVIAEVLAEESDAHVRAALRAWLDGDTGTDPWLEIPAVAKLAPTDRRLDVARRKDKFTVRVRRRARRLIDKTQNLQNLHS